MSHTTAHWPAPQLDNEYGPGSPEYWELGAGQFYGCESDARRIVACVNACAGLTTEGLEAISLSGDTLLDRIKALRVKADQRDELLVALQRIAACPGDNSLATAMAWAAEAIAKVEAAK